MKYFSLKLFSSLQSTPSGSVHISDTTATTKEQKRSRAAQQANAKLEPATGRQHVPHASTTLNIAGGGSAVVSLHGGV